MSVDYGLHDKPKQGGVKLKDNFYGCQLGGSPEICCKDNSAFTSVTH
tara:strand:- start:228 stop:368 length:141 start_codon:yes stop_codon:yes gene_type:complete